MNEALLRELRSIPQTLETQLVALKEQAAVALLLAAVVAGVVAAVTSKLLSGGRS